MVLLKNSVHFDIEHSGGARADQSGENALVALDFAEHGIGEGDFAIRSDRNKLDEALRVADGKITKEQSIDQREDGGVCANS